jgi:hypothetical protein
MPSINYANTVIYKIQCQKNITLCPIFAHTTNLKKTQRKMKYNCINGVSNIHTDIISKTEDLTRGNGLFWKISQNATPSIRQTTV